MKKIITIILTMVMLISSLTIAAQAKTGDIIGSALHTDIVVYINNYAIPSYAVNGQSVVVAEDLRNFGFDVIWNPNNRSLSVSRNANTSVVPMFVDKSATSGSFFTSILETDISVWAAGKRLTSYALNGYTMIPAEELTMFGSVNWVSSERALKIQIEGLDTLTTKQVVSHRYYGQTKAPDFGWVTQSICVQWKDGLTNTYRWYLADANDIKLYTDFIKTQGWVLENSVQGSDGIWYSGYINKKLRTGILIAEQNNLAYVQMATLMDYWDYSGLQ